MKRGLSDVYARILI